MRHNTQSKANRLIELGLDQARSQLPALVTAASSLGRSTVITRRGEPVAALVPLAALRERHASASIKFLALAGSGRGLWGAEPGRFVEELRAEWG